MTTDQFQCPNARKLAEESRSKAASASGDLPRIRYLVGLVKLSLLISPRPDTLEALEIAQEALTMLAKLDAASRAAADQAEHFLCDWFRDPQPFMDALKAKGLRISATSDPV